MFFSCNHCIRRVKYAHTFVRKKALYHVIFCPKRKKTGLYSRLKTWIPACLFILAILLSIKTTYYATEHYLDGDASSELVLAHHLYETGQVLSQDWHYSTELRVLNTQLIFAPLFHFFSDWHMVRFTGALIMQAMLVLSFGYLCKETQLSLGAFFLGAALLISPTSVAYGRIVLYHCYYIPHIILGFLIVALYLSACDKWSRQHVCSALLRTILLLLLSLGSGLGGVRQIIITHLPLFFAVVHQIIADTDTPLYIAIQNNAGKLILNLLCLAAVFFGFIINSTFLEKLYSFVDYTQLCYDIIPPDQLREFVYGLLHQFGFRRQLKILSRSGLITLGSFFITGYYIIQCIYTFIRKPLCSFTRQIIDSFLSCSFLIMFCVFLFSSSYWYFPLYLIPVSIWFIPFLCVRYDMLSITHVFHCRKDAALLLVLFFYIPNIGVNLIFFNEHSNSFEQIYEGLSFQDAEHTDKLQKPFTLLMQQDYQMGFSTFWHANTLTEMSDGQLKMIGLDSTFLNINSNNTKNVPSLNYYKWLTLKPYLDKKPEKVFLLLTSDENKAYLEIPFEYKGDIIYEDDGHFIVYGFDNPDDLYQMIHW